MRRPGLNRAVSPRRGKVCVLSNPARRGTEPWKFIGAAGSHYVRMMMSHSLDFLPTTIGEVGRVLPGYSRGADNEAGTARILRSSPTL